MTPDVGRARGADGLVTAHNESGESYLRDVEAGEATVPIQAVIGWTYQFD